MQITKLKSPILRNRWPRVQLFSFHYSGFLQLPKPSKRKWRSLFTILESRRSERSFQSAISFQDLSSLIHHSAHSHERKILENGALLETRIPPSGGGCHPI